MSRRIHRVGMAAAVLAMALALATPAHAAGLNGWEPGSGLLLRAWQWLTTDLWTGPVEPHGRTNARAGRSTDKEGLGINPVGSTQTTGSTTTSSTTGTSVTSTGG